MRKHSRKTKPKSRFKESLNEKAKRKKLLTDLVKKIKARPCKDCGKEYPFYVMDLDHVSGRKVDNISSMIRNLVPYDILLNELLKCEVRCANCHRSITYNRRLVHFSKLKGKVIDMELDQAPNQKRKNIEEDEEVA